MLIILISVRLRLPQLASAWGCCPPPHRSVGKIKTGMALHCRLAVQLHSCCLFVFNISITHFLSLFALKGAQWSTALALLETVELRGLVLDVISYSAVISACEKGAQWWTALELLADMELRGLVPDVISYNAASSACEKGAPPEKVFEGQC